MFHNQHSLIAIQSNEKAIDIFRIRAEGEIKKKRIRRQKRNEKKEIDHETKPVSIVEPSSDSQMNPLAETLAPYLTVTLKMKCRSFYFNDAMEMNKKSQLSASSTHY